MTTPTIKSLLDKVERVNISTLRHHPSNPRIGNVDLVAKSLDGHSQYKPLVVQKKGKTVLAGNHTLKAARKLGWSQIDVVIVDVDDEKAKQIMLMDNKSSDEGGYDQALLAEVLESLDDTALTGYSTDEIGDILASDNSAAAGGIGEASEQARTNAFNDAPLGEEDEVMEEFDDLDGAEPEEEEFGDEDDEGPSLEGASEELPGALSFKAPEEINFDQLGYWGIPSLDSSKLMRWSEVPEKLTTWAESFSRNKVDPAAQDPDTWWFFNWGMSSSSGMDDISKVIIGFYSFDNNFENWWIYPDRYATKVVNSKIKYAVTPDFSMMTGTPNVFNLWNLYRNRWIARYLQECGIKVCPHVDWPMGDVEFGRRYVWSTLPKQLPLMAMQFQTLTEESVADVYKCKKTEAFDKYADEVLQCLDYMKPEAMLVYAGIPGQALWNDKIAPKIKHDLKFKVLDSRLMRLSHFQGKRERKSTI